MSSVGLTIFTSSGFLDAASLLMALLREARERDLVVRFSMTGCSVLIRLEAGAFESFSLFTPTFFVVVVFLSSPSFFLPPAAADVLLLLRDGAGLVSFSSSFGLAPTLRPRLDLVDATVLVDAAVDDFFLKPFFGATAAAATFASDSAVTLLTSPWK